MHLPAERPLFVRSNDERGEYVLEETSPVSVAALSTPAPGVTRKGALHLAFEQLFASPFDEESVTTYERTVGREADGVVAQVAPPPTPSPARQRLHGAGGVLAVGATTAGVALDVIALLRSRSAAGMSQVAIANANRDVTRLDTASIACYAVGVVGALVWGGTKLWPGTTVAPAPSPSLDGRERGLSFVLQRRF